MLYTDEKARNRVKILKYGLGSSTRFLRRKE